MPAEGSSHCQFLVFVRTVPGKGRKTGSMGNHREVPSRIMTGITLGSRSQAGVSQWAIRGGLGKHLHQVNKYMEVQSTKHRQ